MKLTHLACILPFALLSFIGNGSGDREAVNKISYSIGGGKGSGFSTFTATKDLCVLETENTGSGRIFNAATDPVFWKSISRSDLKAFDAIQSSRRTAPHDGTDEEVTIVTNIKAHSFVNGDYKNSKEVRSLIESLKQKMANIAIPVNRQPADNSIRQNAKEEQAIFSESTVDVKPAFPGGIAKFREYVSRDLHAKKEDSAGNMILSFIVEIDGSLGNVIVKTDLGIAMTAKALQAAQNSPKWNPGEKNGRKVRSMVSVQIGIH